MAPTSATNALQKVCPTRVDRLFLRMNSKEISMVSSVMRHSQRRPLAALLRATNRLANGWIYLPLLFWLLLEREWRLLLVACLGTAVSFLFYFSTKPRLARMRPCHFAESLSTGTQYLDLYSFPSGHCMTLSVISVFLCWQHHAAILPLTAMVLLLAWARIAAAHHYPSDLVAGIAVGLCVGVPVAVVLL
jgi:undecaprenyl-diphosphatase